MEENSIFKDLYSLKQASEIWNVEESVLRRHILKNKFRINYDVKKFGKQWVISKDAMEREYGIINNRNDKTSYSQSKMNDIFYYLSECTIRYSNKHKLDITTVAKLFKKYNIYKYIYDCYDYLHLGNTNNVVNELSSRIRRGIVYVG